MPVTEVINRHPYKPKPDFDMRVQISEFLTWRFGRDVISRMGLDLDNKFPRALLDFFRIQQNNSNDKY